MSCNLPADLCNPPQTLSVPCTNYLSCYTHIPVNPGRCSYQPIASTVFMATGCTNPNVKPLVTRDLTVCGNVEVACDMRVDGNLLAGTIESGTLSLCNLQCDSTMYLTASLAVSISSTLEVTTLASPGEMHIVSPSTIHIDSGTVFMSGTLQTGTLSATGGVLALTSTLDVCTISCPGTLYFDANTVYMAGIVQVQTLDTCTITCSTTLLLQAPVTQIPGVLTLGGTLNTCTVACATTLYLPDEVHIVGSLTTGTLIACAIDCTTPPNMIVIHSILATDTLVVNNVLSVCSIICPLGALQITASTIETTGTLYAAQGLESCTFPLLVSTIEACNTTVNINGNLAVSGTIPLGGLNVGGGTGQVFASVTGNTLNFRTLTSSDNTVSITTNGNLVNFYTDPMLIRGPSYMQLFLNQITVAPNVWTNLTMTLGTLTGTAYTFTSPSTFDVLGAGHRSTNELYLNWQNNVGGTFVMVRYVTAAGFMYYVSTTPIVTGAPLTSGVQMNFYDWIIRGIGFRIQVRHNAPVNMIFNQSGVGPGDIIGGFPVTYVNPQLVIVPNYV